MSISLNNYTCPHCLKENASLIDTAMIVKPVNTNLISLVFTCKSCEHSLIIELDIPSSEYYYKVIDEEKNSLLELHEPGMVIKSPYGWTGRALNVYPTPKAVTIPTHLSNIVSDNFRKAKELLSLGYYDQSGMTSRRVIDLATKELLPDHTGMLNSRIKKLLETGYITPQLFDWADIIKIGGNSATHDYDDFTEHEAKQLLDFTEMFLMYVFTLPKMVELKKEKDILQKPH